MPTYLEWLIQIVAVVVIFIWINLIRHYVSAGLGITTPTVVTTMLWVVSLIVVVLSDASRAHLLWLFPLIFILSLVLTFVFPFTLLKISADIFLRLCCIGIHTELADSAANDPDPDKHLDENRLTGDWAYGAESEDGDDKRNGQGTHTLPDGTKYVGEFRDGKYNGQGTNTFPDGEKYVGEWRDDKRHGQGTHTYADGRIMEGIWENGELGKSD